MKCEHCGLEGARPEPSCTFCLRSQRDEARAKLAEAQERREAGRQEYYRIADISKQHADRVAQLERDLARAMEALTEIAVPQGPGASSLHMIAYRALANIAKSKGTVPSVFVHS